MRRKCAKPFPLGTPIYLPRCAFARRVRKYSSQNPRHRQLSRLRLCMQNTPPKIDMIGCLVHPTRQFKSEKSLYRFCRFCGRDTRRKKQLNFNGSLYNRSNRTECLSCCEILDKRYLHPCLAKAQRGCKRVPRAKTLARFLCNSLTSIKELHIFREYKPLVCKI